MKTKKPQGYNDINKRIREVRVSNNLTQVEMGKIVGMSSSAIGAIENCLYTPNFRVLRVLKKKLGVSYDFIIDGDRTSQPELLREVKKLRAENGLLKKVIEKLT